MSVCAHDGDFLGAQPVATVAQMIVCQAGAGNPGFNATKATAVAAWRRACFFIAKGQRIVPPFPGNTVNAINGLVTNDNTSSHPSAKDDAENYLGTLSGTIDGFRKREAIRVVSHPDSALQQRLQVTPQRLTDQAGGIGILDKARAQGFSPRNPDSHSSLLPRLAFDGFDQTDNGRQGSLVIVLWGSDTPPNQGTTRLIENDNFNFRTA
jgi:hypothetical protein